ncbi:hypothetical protein [Jannaschia seohaensis]|uniref:Response regulatory domain-containing protein n=1 Tax=Jannaschia seohaensis TaxID=475081 RepID=A0A2Y9A4D1_9RHOB|nr:hypothetical protein [Jannaschia seohaensis]PWJ22468.1 hypothetical protein BCF38_101882 [Jannaschia seohaensis]SSA38746.1 hypothetical protein SAMN05421539_101882 [Jannaschia seohaensis]
MIKTSAHAATAPLSDRIARDDRPVVLTVGFTLQRGREATAAWDDFRAEVAQSQAQAVAKMFVLRPAVVLIDLGLTDGSPLAVADFVSFRHPKARVIFVSDTAMFSDGSLFQHCANVHAHVARGMAEPDMVALIAHHAKAELQRR